MGSLDEGVNGIQLVGDEVKIAKDQTQNILMIEAANDASVGEHTLTIKATVRLHDQDLVLDRNVQVVVEASNDEAQPE